MTVEGRGQPTARPMVAMHRTVIRQPRRSGQRPVGWHAAVAASGRAVPSAHLSTSATACSAPGDATPSAHPMAQQPPCAGRRMVARWPRLEQCSRAERHSTRQVPRPLPWAAAPWPAWAVAPCCGRRRALRRPPARLQGPVPAYGQGFGCGLGCERQGGLGRERGHGCGGGQRQGVGIGLSPCARQPLAPPEAPRCALSSSRPEWHLSPSWRPRCCLRRHRPRTRC